MRRAALVGLALLFAPLARAAEPVAFRGVVVTDEAKLRAGPSDSFPETGTLARGTAVVVEREEPNGWLAITAPKGSVSWVAAAFLEDLAPEKPTPKLAMVHSEGDVTVASGKPGLAQPLDVRREKLPQGTMVMLIGPKVEFNGKKWFPVEPPAGDVRYVPKTAIQYDRPANTNAFSVRINESATPLPVVPASGSGSPAASVPGPARVQPPSGAPVVNNDLWIRAEAAERVGKFSEAERLYFELAGQMNREGGDNTVANLCYTRIHALREKNRAASAPTGSGTTSSAKDDRSVRPGAPQAVPPSERPVSRPTTDATESRPQWSGGGTLRRSAITPNGKITYALEASPGVVKWYVTAGAGVDLERWIGKRVEVYGTPGKIDGLSKPLATAVAVEPLQ